MTARTRQLGRWLVLALCLAALGPWAREAWQLFLLPAFSPFVAAGGALAARALGAVTLLALPVLILVVLVRRGFCRYACPTGLLLELIARLRGTNAPEIPKKFPRLNSAIALLTFGGATLGYPLFLWLDPLALFNGFLGALRWPFQLATLVTGIGFGVLVMLELLRPGLWCARLCPLGATQEWLVWPRERMQGGPPPIAGRRAFLAAGGGAVGVWLVGVARGKSQPPLRPPGALGEGRFSGVCIRCGNCERVCPSRIIQPDLGAAGLASLLTPTLRFSADYCRENCTRCLEVCPSGALARLTLEQKRKHVIGLARLDLDICLLAAGQECTECIKSCPFEALAVQSAEGGFFTQPVLELKKCNGCGACEANCPVRPRRAIRISR
jgi:ferredoxin-type protein NapF